MKKMMVALLSFAFALCGALALPDIELPSDGALYDGPVHENARATLAATLRAEFAAQVNTNANPSITGHTPRYVGDLVVAPNSTNVAKAWLALGMNTNDWAVIVAVE